MVRGRNSIGLCCALGLAAGGAQSAEWSAQPMLSMSADVDTNRRLTDPATTSRAAVLNGRLELARATEAHRLSLRPRFALRRYDGVSDAFDSNDAGVDFDFERRGERSTIRLGATASEDGTLTTELADTGIVEGRARRRTTTAHSDASLQTGERSHFEAGASFVDVRFDDAAGTGLTPYRYPGAFLGLSFAASDRSRLRFTANAGRLEVPVTGTRIDNLAVRASWSAEMTERFNIEVSGGMSRSDSGFTADQGAVFGITSAWSGQRSTLNVALARDVEPSALGRMVEVDSISGSWRWLAGERTTLTFSLRHLRREDLLFGLFPERRDYSTAYAALGWRLTPDWNLELRAGGSRQSYELIDVEVEGERAALSVTWSPRKRAMAR